MKAKIDLNQRPWDVLNLNIRIINALWSNDIMTLCDLCAKKPSEILRCRNFGKKSLTIIEKELERFGLSLLPKPKCSTRDRIGLTISRVGYKIVKFGQEMRRND